MEVGEEPRRREALELLQFGINTDGNAGEELDSIIISLLKKTRIDVWEL
jgi:hypothetical protein